MSKPKLPCRDASGNDCIHKKTYRAGGQRTDADHCHHPKVGGVGRRRMSNKTPKWCPKETPPQKD